MPPHLRTPPLARAVGAGARRSSARALLLLASFVGAGCIAYGSAPPVSEADLRLLEAEPLPYVVAVVPEPQRPPTSVWRIHRPERDAWKLFHRLQDCGAFREVRFGLDGDPPADLVASTGPQAGDASGTPPWTFMAGATVCGLSLGVIPAVWNIEHDEVVLLGAAGSDSAEPLRLERRVEELAVFGWVAGPLGLFPGWTRAEAHRRRLREGLRVEFLRQREAIEALAR